MKYLLKKTDFEVITTPNRDRLLFYTPNTQIYSLTNTKIKEYITICNNTKKYETSFLNSQDIIEIYEFLNKKFNNSLPSTILKKFPKTEFKTVILPVSGKCNLRCSYCFASMNGEFTFKDFTSIDSKRIIDFLFKKLKLNEINMVFFGGEPLLNLQTIEFVIDYIKENYHEKKIIYSITTNGTILNDKILKIIKENDISILISIDGPKELTNHRKDSSGKSSFDQTIKNIDRLKNEGVIIHLRATLTNDVVKLVEIYDFFEKLEIPFKIIFAHDSENKNYDLANYKNNLKVLKKQLNCLVLYYIALVGENKKIYCDSITEKLKFLLYRTQNYSACTGGRTMFSITSEGDIYSCEHLAGYTKYSVGNIDKGINRIKLNDLRSTNVEKIESCKNCWLRYFCAGGCFSNNLTSTSNVRKPDKNRCELLKLEYKFIIALYYEINKKYSDFFQLADK